MRIALIGIFLAATAVSPLSAQTADEPEVREGMRARAASEDLSERRAERQSRREVRQPEARPDVPRQETRVERQEERREERREVREERREARQDRRNGDTVRQSETRRIPSNIILRPRTDSRADRREDRRDDRADRREDRREDRAERREDRRDARQDRRAWNRAWRSDRRYDWQRYRYSNRSLFDLGSYYAPIWGHRYSRFSVGLRLGSPFLSHRYWIDDPWRYRLPPAYAGTRWVRYYDDVLLVDLFTGEVVDVLYNFFW